MTQDEMKEHDELFRAESEASRERKANGDTSPAPERALTPDDMTAAETDEYNAGIAAMTGILDQAVRQTADDPAVARYRELRKKYNFDAPKPEPVETWEPLPEPDPDSYEWYGYYHDFKHKDAGKPTREDRRLALVIVTELIRCMFIDPLESEFNETVEYATSAVLKVLRRNTDLMRDAALMADAIDSESGAA